MKRLGKKKLIFFGVIALIVIIGVVISFVLCKEEKVGGKDDLLIIYEKGSEIKINDLSKEYENEITIKNNTEEDITYSFSFTDVKNNVKEGNKFLYKVSAGDKKVSPEVEKSQMPGGELELFPSVYIKAKTEHTYKIKVWYEGKETKKDSFSAKLYIKSHKKEADKAKKEESELQKKLEKEMKEKTETENKKNKIKG